MQGADTHAGPMLWCSACGAYSQEKGGKAQILFSRCAGLPPTASLASQLALMKRGIHPHVKPKRAREADEQPWRFLDKAYPVADAEIAVARDGAVNKRARVTTELQRSNPLFAANTARPQPLPIASWVAHLGLSAEHFARDDRRQALKLRRRLRGRTPPTLEGSSKETC